jgi:hypothetical protein
MRTLVKFYSNSNAESHNLLITRTLGKVGTLTSECFYGKVPVPQSGEWWYCDVVDETKHGTNKGCFVLKPVERVDPIEHDHVRKNDINYLVPGNYDCVRKGNTLLLHPRIEGPNWICSRNLRTYLMRAYGEGDEREIAAVVVVFDKSDDWPRSSSDKAKT